MTDPFATDEKRTVLVVDDDPSSLEVLKDFLADEYEVRLADSGAGALEAVKQDPRPDAILLDITMPGMDGFQVCALLKADEATRDIPVIFLTAKADAENAELAFELGCADYITKPVLPPVVRARVRTHVTLRAAREYFKAQRSRT